MAAEPVPITSENVFDVEVENLAMDSRFGSLVFENANKKLTKAQLWLKEVRDLEYREVLLPDDANTVDQLRNQLVEHLHWLQNFDIGTAPNPKAEHDNFESRVDGFYNTIHREIRMKFLPFLRDERRRERPNEKEADQEVKKIVKLRTELEAELRKVQEETEKLRVTGKDVGSATGTRAAVRLAKHFNDEADEYKKAAKYWFAAVIWGYAFLLGILMYLGFNAISHITDFTAPDTSPNLGLIWTIGIAKLVVIGALWYALSFIVKNYNVNSHLASVNRHRATVARTLEDFITAEQSQEKPRLSEMLQNAADSMFKHAAIGFVSKTEKETASPVLQIVNDIIGLKS